MTYIVGEYTRSRDGKTIHLEPCPASKNAVRWTYADGMGLRAVASAVAATPWLSLCKRCWPADAYSTTDAR